MNMLAKFLFILFMLSVCIPAHAQEPGIPDAGLDIARFDDSNRLIRPDNIDEWIFLGANVGHGYPDEGDKGFALDNPGRIQIIQMEPNAYQFFRENKYFVNGTMLSLAFYDPLDDPAPDIDGLAQGKLDKFEIHLIDNDQYQDTRAFFVYEADEVSASMVADGNRCVTCHEGEGDYDGTFSQFYPVIRELLSD